MIKDRGQPLSTPLRSALVALSLCLTGVFETAVAKPLDDVNGITLWSRKKGRFSDDQNPTKARPMTVDVADRTLVRRRMRDAQYGREVTVRGLRVADLIALYRPASHDDLALLHFENGMLIPLPLDAATLAKVDAFLAVSICATGGRCTGEFPSVAKEDAYAVTNDPRPITFSWNKIVVPSAWHPEVPSSRTPAFSPWRHADSLIGIEFVSARAYYAQFALGEPEGLAVFRERCQFCHGARYVGAQYGWDFVTPLPLFEKRTPETLLNHVKYPKVSARDSGLMMPPQSDVTADEMTAIWRWMRKSAAKPLPAYRP